MFAALKRFSGVFCWMPVVLLSMAGSLAAQDFKADFPGEVDRLVSAMAACRDGDQDRDACEDGYQAVCADRYGWTTLAMTFCQTVRHTYWDEALNWTYARVMEQAETHRPELRDELRETQRLWIAYRDARCGVYQHFDGTIWRPAPAACMAESTKDRTADLQEVAEGAGFDLVPVVSWRSGTALEIDLNCDGVEELIVAGIRKAAHWEGVVLAAQEGDQRHEFLSFPVDPQHQSGVCASSVTLAKETAGVNQTCPVMRIDDGLCDSVRLSWEREAGEYLMSRN